MLSDLIQMQVEVTSKIPMQMQRYLYSQVHWQSKGLCLLGDRGVGKTTILCQDLLKRYASPLRALYISADYVQVLSYGLVSIAKDFFAEGGEALYIDEVHKYPHWSLEVKNLLDVYKTKQIIFSGSSSLDLNASKGDLSRRVVYYRLLGLSFREYLELAKAIELPVLTMQEILTDHVTHAAELVKKHPMILQYFKTYLAHGYYPFFMEGLEDYIVKLGNVIEKVLFEDVATVYQLRPTTIPVLKKILWLVATSNGLIPNIDKISKNIAVSRELIYDCIEYLTRSGLLSEVLPYGRGNTLIRKPGKIYLNNTNLLHAIYGSLKLEMDAGGVRETFFVNQVSVKHKICLHDKADFFIDDKWVMEVGGKNKGDYQIRSEKESFLVLDEMPIGFGKKIPLYLFGFLY